MRGKMKDPLSIANILEKGRSDSKLNSQLIRCELWRDWDEIAGVELSKKIRPSRWHGDTLIIKTRSSAWLNELNFMKDELLNRIKRAVPKIRIRDIRVEIGSF